MIMSKYQFKLAFSFPQLQHYLQARRTDSTLLHNSLNTILYKYKRAASRGLQHSLKPLTLFLENRSSLNLQVLNLVKSLNVGSKRLHREIVSIPADFADYVKEFVHIT